MVLGAGHVVGQYGSLEVVVYQGRPFLPLCPLVVPQVKSLLELVGLALLG